MSNSLTIFNYSEKAIAVFGNTEQHKTKLTELGGKYNPRLKKEGEITPGWIFSKSKRTQIQEFINQINTIVTQEITSNEVNDNIYVSITKKQYNCILSRLENLEILLKTNHSDICQPEYLDLDEQNEHQEKPRRLLR